MKTQGSNIGSSLAEAGGTVSSSLLKFISETRKSTADELGKTRKDIQSQIFGLEKQLNEGDEIALSDSAEQKQEEKKPVSAEHQAYVREFLAAPTRQEHAESQQLKAQIEEIRFEIEKLKKASSEMEVVFKEVSSQEVPEKPGKYHLAFYEWVLITIQNTRKKMEEVNVLGRIFQSRKKEKQYLGMAKKHGTSFTLHHERAIVRQTG